MLWTEFEQHFLFQGANRTRGKNFLPQDKGWVCFFFPCVFFCIAHRRLASNFLQPLFPSFWFLLTLDDRESLLKIKLENIKHFVSLPPFLIALYSLLFNLPAFSLPGKLCPSLSLFPKWPKSRKNSTGRIHKSQHIKHFKAEMRTNAKSKGRKVMVLKTANIQVVRSFIPSVGNIPFDSSSFPSSTLHFLIHLLHSDTRNNFQIEFVHVHIGSMDVLSWAVVCMQKREGSGMNLVAERATTQVIHSSCKKMWILFVYRSSTPTRSCATTFFPLYFRPLFWFPASLYPSRCGCPRRRKWSLSITIKDERKNEWRKEGNHMISFVHTFIPVTVSFVEITYSVPLFTIVHHGVMARSGVQKNTGFSLPSFCRNEVHAMDI